MVLSFCTSFAKALLLYWKEVIPHVKIKPVQLRSEQIQFSGVGVKVVFILLPSK